MTIATNLEADCKVCHKPILSRRSTLQTKCAPCVYKEANARDRELRNAQRQAVRVARQQHAADRRETKRKLEAIKPRSKWLKEAQASFNAWVRARDEAAGLPCISCGRHHQGQIHAGHYLSVGARPELRFEPLNVWSQCQPCNVHLHGNLVNYRIELVKRIGLELVERLEGPHPAKHYSVDDLRLIRDNYRVKARELQKEMA